MNFTKHIILFSPRSLVTFLELSGVWLMTLMILNAEEVPPAEDNDGLELAMPMSEEISLWPAGHLPEAEKEERLLPERADGVVRLTDVTQPTLRIFPARDGEGELIVDRPSPAVVICPGGGYAILSIKKEGWDVAEWFSRIGVTAIVLKYRVPKNREAAYEDVQRALRVVRHRAKRWKIDPEKVGVLGFSAGGHLAACLNAGFGQRSSAELDEVDRMSCRPDFTVLVYPAYLQDKKLNGADEGSAVAKEVLVGKKTPPTLIIHTEDDVKFVEGSRRYARMLGKSGVNVSVELYKEGGHGYGLGVGKPLVSQWPGRCRKWLVEMGLISASGR